MNYDEFIEELLGEEIGMRATRAQLCSFSIGEELEKLGYNDNVSYNVILAILRVAIALGPVKKEHVAVFESAMCQSVGLDKLVQVVAGADSPTLYANVVKMINGLPPVAKEPCVCLLCCALCCDGPLDENEKKLLSQVA